MLHDVVSDVKTGDYGITSNGDCSGATTPGDAQNRTVVIIGHSAGGWVVAGYPGEYHDVAAMIQTDISGSAGGSRQARSEARPRAAASRPTPPPRLLPVLPDHPELPGLQHLHAGRRPVRREHRLHAAVPRTRPTARSPTSARCTPERRIHRHDRPLDPSAPHLRRGRHNRSFLQRDADYDYYKTYCGCDVAQLLLPNTAHLFMVHKSLPTWVDYVVNWLTAPASPAPPELHLLAGVGTSSSGAVRAVRGAAAPATTKRPHPGTKGYRRLRRASVVALPDSVVSDSVTRVRSPAKAARLSSSLRVDRCPSATMRASSPITTPEPEAGRCNQSLRGFVHLPRYVQVESLPLHERAIPRRAQFVDYASRRHASRRFEVTLSSAYR